MAVQHSSLFIFPAFIIHPLLKLRSCVYIWIFFLSNFDTLFAGSEFIFGTKLPSECNEETKRISSSQDYLVFERENTRFLNNRKLWKVITRRDKENSKFVVPSLRSTRILATVSVEQFYFRREAVKKKKKEALFYFIHRRNVFIALESGAGLRLIRFLGRVKRRSTISAPRKLVNWLSVCGL